MKQETPGSKRKFKRKLLSRNKEKENYWNRKLTKKAEQQIQVIKLKESEYNSKWQESLELHLSVIINKKSIPI